MKIMEEKKIIQDNNINEIEKNSDEAFLLYEKAFGTFDVKKKRTYLKKALALSPLDIDIKLAFLEKQICLRLFIVNDNFGKLCYRPCFFLIFIR